MEFARGYRQVTTATLLNHEATPQEPCILRAVRPFSHYHREEGKTEGIDRRKEQKDGHSQPIFASRVTQT